MSVSTELNLQILAYVECGAFAQTSMESHGSHVAVFPSPGMGHLIPLVEFAKRLTLYHGFSVTFIIPKWMTVSHRQNAYVQRVVSSAVCKIHFIELPHVEIEGDDAEMNGQTRQTLLKEKTKPFLEDALRSSSFHFCAFITDLFCTTMFDVTSKLEIPSYIFFTSSASLLCLMLYLPTLVQNIEISFKDVDFEIEVPGLKPILGRDLPTPIQDRSNSIDFNWFLQHSSRLHEARGFLINSCEDMEAEQIKALLEGKVLLSADKIPSIYAVGPFISSSLLASDEEVGEDKEECLKWLDRQPASSVLFVSFGSMGTLSDDQVQELALGLEASGQRFLWVLRRPPSILSTMAESDIRHILPVRFESRTRDRGLVVSSWAPQIPVLSHPSTGGFLSHCGWNSTIESILHGVPMIAWPLFAEQRMNALYLVKEKKVAIEAKKGPDGLVSKEEVGRVARELMEGDGAVEMKKRMRKSMKTTKNAIAEGGSSYNDMATVAAIWKGMDATNTTSKAI